MPTHSGNKSKSGSKETGKTSGKSKRSEKTSVPASTAEIRVSTNPDTAEGSREDVDLSLQHDNTDENGDGPTLH
jgi:hypothetical protein